MGDQQQDDQKQEQGMTSRVGIQEIDWPKTVGYYGGIGLALAFELIEPPVAAFIAFIPLFKLLGHPKLPMPARIAGQVLEGASQPVGGADEATIHLVDDNQGSKRKKRQGQGSSIWSEARAMADRQRQRRLQSGQQGQQQAAG